MSEPKTSTFTIDHERCKPAEWRPKDVLALADFIRTGSLMHAATLSRLGMKLLLSEHHVPKGGALEEIGWLRNGDFREEAVTDDLSDICDDEITAAARIYRGPIEHIVYVRGEDDDVIETFATEEKATEYRDSLYDDQNGHPGANEPDKV